MWYIRCDVKIIILQEYYAVPSDKFSYWPRCFQLTLTVVCFGKTIPCLWLITEVFQLKVNWAKLKSCFVCVCVCVCELKQLFFLVFCVVWVVHKLRFEPVIEEITKNVDQWKEIDKDSWTSWLHLASIISKTLSSN